MKAEEVIRLVNGLGRVKRIIWQEARARGVVSAPDLRGPTGRSDGMTDEIQYLMQLGLLRVVGTKESPTGKPAVSYEAVPFDEIEATAQAYSPPVKKKLSAHEKRPSERQLRRLLKGNYTPAFNVYTKVLDLSKAVAGPLVSMIFAKEATEDELNTLDKELAYLIKVATEAREQLAVRKEDDKIRRRIEKMESMNGREGPEAESFKAGAERLRKQLP